jgi:hypothetical protein
MPHLLERFYEPSRLYNGEWLWGFFLLWPQPTHRGDVKILEMNLTSTSCEVRCVKTLGCAYLQFHRPAFLQTLIATVMPTFVYRQTFFPWDLSYRYCPK